MSVGKRFFCRRRGWRIETGSGESRTSPAGSLRQRATQVLFSRPRCGRSAPAGQPRESVSSCVDLCAEPLQVGSARRRKISRSSNSSKEVDMRKIPLPEDEYLLRLGQGTGENEAACGLAFEAGRLLDPLKNLRLICHSFFPERYRPREATVSRSGGRVSERRRSSS